MGSIVYERSVGDLASILVVDDDAAVCELVSTVLRRAGFVAREAKDANDAVAAVDRQEPAVAVIDVHLGMGASGYELCRELQDRFEALPVIFISGVRTEAFDRVAGLLIGAHDYVVKPFDPDELVARVRRRATERAHGNGGPQAPLPDAFMLLTPREREVLQLLAEGRNQAAIAEALFLSPKTIATHLQKILAKLGVHSRAEAIAYAYRHRLFAV